MNIPQTLRKIEKLNTSTALSAAFALIVLLGFATKLHLMGESFYAFLVFAATILYVFFSAKQIIVSNNILNELIREYKCSETYSGNTWFFPKRAQETVKITLNTKAINILSNELDNPGSITEKTYHLLKQAGDVRFYGVKNISLLTTTSKPTNISLNNELQVVEAILSKHDEMKKLFDISRDYKFNSPPNL